jgi:hypothetical protein
MRILVPVLAAVLITAGCERTTETTKTDQQAPRAEALSDTQAARTSSIGGPDGTVVAEFNRRIKDYMALQSELESTLKDLPDKASPREIDANQRALGALIAKARSDAKPGQVFAPEMQAFARGVIRHVLEGPDGAKLKASIQDENPQDTAVQVNGRYPDAVPLSTMPPDVLAALPQLPEELEYRFVGNRLILLDAKAHIVVDYVSDVFPR